MPKYDPEKDIPNLSGKVILVTGGTAGLGAQTVTLLAAHSPAHIFFTGRSANSADRIILDLKSKHPSVPITFLQIDLASFVSIQTGAKQFLSQSQRLDFLICNAGVMALPPGLTKDGYEIQFGTNHMSHALLIKLLLPTLLSTAKLPGADVRVVSLTSEGNQGHPMGGIIFKDLKTTQEFHILGPWQRYGQSKLANILYTAELARKYSDSGILFLSIHPGVFNTGLIQNLSLGTRAFICVTTFGQAKDETKGGQGAWNTCWAATSKREGIENGGFYFPVGAPGRKARDNTNDKLAVDLWEWTQKEIEAWN